MTIGSSGCSGALVRPSPSDLRRELGFWRSWSSLFQEFVDSLERV